MAKTLKGVGDATFRFLLAGVLLPYALAYFYPEVSKYVTLPPSQNR